jgi:hypothetical protein
VRFTHLPCFLTVPFLQCFDFVGLRFFAFVVALGVGAGKFPTPLNVTLAGVAKIGGAGGTPWQPEPEQAGGVGGEAAPTRTSYRS